MKPKFGDLKLWWEMGKIQVVCQQYTSSFTAKLSMTVEELEASIKDIEMTQRVTPPLVIGSRRR